MLAIRRDRKATAMVILANHLESLQDAMNELLQSCEVTAIQARSIGYLGRFNAAMLFHTRTHVALIDLS